MRLNVITYTGKLILIAAVIPVIAGLTGCVPPGARNRDRYIRSYDYRKDPGLSEERKRIVDTAMSYIGTPYRSGGSSPRGFDCSGFAMFVYRRHGMRIDRTVTGQYRKGRQIDIRSARAGDLVFFDISGGRVSHVGIYIGGGEFVHAPSSGKTVRVDEISNPYWNERYFGAARYIR